MSPRRVLIVGGSTRAAADSVRRAGWQPVCADLFADQDLRSTAEVIPVRNYPFSLPDDIAHVKADAWFYCGALENQPDLIESLSARASSIGPLLGSSSKALRRVRNPFWLSNTLRFEGVPALAVVDQSTPPEPDGAWVQKPLASAGGRMVRVWDESAARIPFSEPHYFQSRAPGIGLSAIFDYQNNQTEWLGASQERDAPATSKPPSRFAYCGSCGPLESLPDNVRQTLEKIARILGQQAPGLGGLVGLDFRLHDDQVWLTEVNPRYTASVEVLELASGRSLLNPDACPISTQGVVIKEILYASADLVAPDLSRYVISSNPWSVPFMADIPVVGTPIEAGWPICTVLASGKSVEIAEETLRDRIKQIRTDLNER